jgi:geranylgeranyl diphosphate synthase type II
MVKILSKATWFYWMIWGQVEDLYYEEKNTELTQDKLLALHRKKTGKLIKASVKMWIIMSWNTKYLKPFSAFWEKLGLAFQIKDDILDVEWTAEETGKSVWEWNNEKKWFIFFEWLKKSKQKLKDLVKSCLEISKTLKSEKLEFITEYVGNRKK